MTEQNQTPATDDAEGHHFRDDAHRDDTHHRTADDAEGHHFRRDDDTEGRLRGDDNDDDVEGHQRRR
jgi:hypothetical protein